MDCLKTLCVKHLASNLDVESVTETFLLADMHQVAELKSKCINFITEKSNQVISTEGWKSFMRANRIDLMAELFEKACNKNKA